MGIVAPFDAIRATPGQVPRGEVVLRTLKDPAERSRACEEITESLGAWFGRPEANAGYARGIAEREVLAVERGGQVLGALALEYRSASVAEVWWLGVRRVFHRKGLGRQLMAAARGRARVRGARDMVVLTVGPESADPAYAATRAFYEAEGFRRLPLDPKVAPAAPMIWMGRPLWVEPRRQPPRT